MWAVKSHPPAESCPGVFLCSNFSLLYTRVKQHFHSKHSLKVEKLSHGWYFRFLLQRNRRSAVQPILRTVSISQEFQIYLSFHVLYIWTKTLACNCTQFCQQSIRADIVLVKLIWFEKNPMYLKVHACEK